MKILFLGAVEFSRQCLSQVIECGGDVTAVMTLAPENGGFHADYADLGPLAAAHGISLHHIRNINDPDTMDLIRDIAPDVIFVFGWSQIIKRPVLDLPPLGVIGTHPTLLPRNRGRHPLIWALVHDLKESGLTFFYMDEGADSGDILWQGAFPIEPTNDAGDLYRKMITLGKQGIAEFLPQMQAGVAPRRPQDHDKANYWRKRTAADGIIDWAAPSRQSYNLIRALARPYVGASTMLAEDAVTIWRATCPGSGLPKSAAALPAGTVFECESGGLAVRTGDGHLEIVDWDAGGQTVKPMDRFEVVSCA